MITLQLDVQKCMVSLGQVSFLYRPALYRPVALEEELHQLACVASQLSQGECSNIHDSMSLGCGTELGT